MPMIPAYYPPNAGRVYPPIKEYVSTGPYIMPALRNITIHGLHFAINELTSHVFRTNALNYPLLLSINNSMRMGFHRDIL
jgi:hypothetical protein